MKTEKLKFIKMHGAGNDYIFIDCIRDDLDMDWSSLARRLSDRHFGIGSDGLVLILPSDSADFRMRMFNKDGSEAQICGNALRCVAKYLFEEDYTSGEEMMIETIPGAIRAIVNTDKAKVESVSVELPKPEFNSPDLPRQTANKPMIDYPLEIGGREFAISCVSVGNPHAVIFLDRLEGFPVSEIGPSIECHPLFPERTNVEFVKVERRDKIRVRIWERGSGETLACGSGACAAGVVSVYLGKTDDNIEVMMPGGGFRVQWKGHKIILTGPAEEVFRGEIEI